MTDSLFSVMEGFTGPKFHFLLRKDVNLMKLKSFGGFAAVATTLTTCAGIGFAFGSHRGYSHGFDAYRRLSDVTSYPVPSDYTSALTPVPYREDASFVFDTLVFVDEQGREMALPVPASR
ncbi:hypothetical protein [Crateriforma conspicua]|nr:hypothetical protein [Crateriforma conspicua]